MKVLISEYTLLRYYLFVFMNIILYLTPSIVKLNFMFYLGFIRSFCQGSICVRGFFRKI